MIFTEINAVIAASPGADLDKELFEEIRTNLGQTVSTVTASRTLAIADAYNILNATAAAEITIPLNATVAFGVGTSIDIASTTAGAVTVVGVVGVDVRRPAGKDLTLRLQYSVAKLTKLAADEWVMSGDLLDTP